MKMTITFKGEEEFYRSLIKIEKQLESGVEISAKEAAQWFRLYVRESWSPSSPSAPYSPPSVVTGNLDSSIDLEEQGRVRGRFAKAGTGAVYIRINTADGDDPRKRGNYAQVLEFGRREGAEMAPRPFFEPALDRVADEYPGIIKDIVRLRP